MGLFSRKKEKESVTTNEAVIICDVCGESYYKSEMKKCHSCGAVLCPKCRQNHSCHDSVKEIHKHLKKFKRACNKVSSALSYIESSRREIDNLEKSIDNWYNKPKSNLSFGLGVSEIREAEEKLRKLKYSSPSGTSSIDTSPINVELSDLSYFGYINAQYVMVHNCMLTVSGMGKTVMVPLDIDYHGENRTQYLENLAKNGDVSSLLTLAGPYELSEPGEFNFLEDEIVNLISRKVTEINDDEEFVHRSATITFPKKLGISYPHTLLSINRLCWLEQAKMYYDRWELDAYIWMICLENPEEIMERTHLFSASATRVLDALKSDIECYQKVKEFVWKYLEYLYLNKADAFVYSDLTNWVGTLLHLGVNVSEYNEMADIVYFVGLSYLRGDTVKQDYETAVLCFRDSLKYNSDALVELGICYYEGKGLYQNELKVRELMNEASKLDNVRAIDFLAQHPEFKMGQRITNKYYTDGDLIQGNTGVIIKDDAVVNRVAGPSRDVALSQEIQSENAYKYCIYCGKKLPCQAIYCMVCGKKLDEL